VWRHGEQCHVVDGRPGESRCSRGVVARPVPAQERLQGGQRSGWSSGRRSVPIRRYRRRGPVRGTVVAVATSCPLALQQRRGCRHSARRGAVVAGMTAQG
jgi:hypothetical protein